MATFPSYLTLLWAGFGKQRESAVLRSEMESGPPKQAKVKSRVMVTRTVVYRANSKSDYTAFITWFNTTINRGASWFDWTDPEDSVTKQARIVGGLLDKETPARTLLDIWDISFKLEVWDA